MNYLHKMWNLQKKAFTLLELIIVIVIVGVLAAVALPKLFSAIEYSRSAEALAMFTTLRRAYERCYLMSGGSYNGCATVVSENPPGSNAHFFYVPNVFPLDNQHYMIMAVRNTRDGGNGGQINYDQNGNVITIIGYGPFAGLKY